MIGLEGSLAGIGLPPLVGLLADLGKSGRLRIWPDQAPDQDQEPVRLPHRSVASAASIPLRNVAGTVAPVTPATPGYSDPAGRPVVELVFHRGQMVAAAFGRRRGLAALEAAAQALRDGWVSFVEGTVAVGYRRNLALGPGEVQAYLDQLAVGATQELSRPGAGVRATERARTTARPRGGFHPSRLRTRPRRAPVIPQIVGAQ